MTPCSNRLGTTICSRRCSSGRFRRHPRRDLPQAVEADAATDDDESDAATGEDGTTAA